MRTPKQEPLNLSDGQIMVVSVWLALYLMMIAMSVAEHLSPTLALIARY